MFLSQIWGTIIGKSLNRHCRCLGFDVIYYHRRVHCELWCVSWALALCSGADDLLMTQLSCHGLHYRITAQTPAQADGKQRLERAAGSVA